MGVRADRAVAGLALIVSLAVSGCAANHRVAEDPLATAYDRQSHLIPGTDDYARAQEHYVTQHRLVGGTKEDRFAVDAYNAQVFDHQQGNGEMPAAQPGVIRR